MNKIKQLVQLTDSKIKTTLLNLKIPQVIALLKTILKPRTAHAIPKTPRRILIIVLVHKIKVNQTIKMIKVLKIIIQHKIRVNLHQTTQAHKTVQKMQQIKTIIHHKILTIAQTSSLIIHQLIQMINKTKMKQTMVKLKTNLILKVIPLIIMFLKIRLISIILQVKTKLKLIIQQIKQTKPIKIIQQVDKIRPTILQAMPTKPT